MEPRYVLVCFGDSHYIAECTESEVISYPVVLKLLVSPVSRECPTHYSHTNTPPLTHHSSHTPPFTHHPTHTLLLMVPNSSHVTLPTHHPSLITLLTHHSSCYLTPHKSHFPHTTPHPSPYSHHHSSHPPGEEMTWSHWATFSCTSTEPVSPGRD